jgi:hypothetical protein
VVVASIGLARDENIWIIPLVIALCFMIVVVGIVCLVRFTRNYKGPEYIGAGSGTVIGAGLSVLGLLIWGAVELVRTLLA